MWAPLFELLTPIFSKWVNSRKHFWSSVDSSNVLFFAGESSSLSVLQMRMDNLLEKDCFYVHCSCVHACVRTGACMCRDVHSCACAGACEGRGQPWILNFSTCSRFLRQGFSLAWNLPESRDPPVFLATALCFVVYKCSLSPVFSLHWFWDQNSSPQAEMTTLLTYFSPHSILICIPSSAQNLPGMPKLSSPEVNYLRSKVLLFFAIHSDRKEGGGGRGGEN